MRTAATLNSGIFATGSRAAMVSKFAAASLKWKVMKTTPGSGSVYDLSFGHHFAASRYNFDHIPIGDA
jgi:hypothetical protein